MAPEKALHPLREREQREKDISMREGRVRKRVRKTEEGGEKSVPEKLGTGRPSTTLGHIGKGSALEIVDLS